MGRDVQIMVNSGVQLRKSKPTCPITQATLTSIVSRRTIYCLDFLEPYLGQENVIRQCHT